MAGLKSPPAIYISRAAINVNKNFNTVLQSLSFNFNLQKHKKLSQLFRYNLWKNKFKIV